MKPVEKTFTNDQYKRMKRAGLERVIEDEKESADRQYLLRWTVAGTSDTGVLNTSCCGRKSEKIQIERKLVQTETAEGQEKRKRQELTQHLHFI